MKKSELIQKLIEIEETNGVEATITLPYLQHLKKLKRLVEVGDVELDSPQPDVKGIARHNGEGGTPDNSGDGAVAQNPQSPSVDTREKCKHGIYKDVCGSCNKPSTVGGKNE